MRICEKFEGFLKLFLGSQKSSAKCRQLSVGFCLTRKPFEIFFAFSQFSQLEVLYIKRSNFNYQTLL